MDAEEEEEGEEERKRESEKEWGEERRGQRWRLSVSL